MVNNILLMPSYVELCWSQTKQQPTDLFCFKVWHIPLVINCCLWPFPWLKIQCTCSTHIKQCTKYRYHQTSNEWTDSRCRLFAYGSADATVIQKPYHHIITCLTGFYHAMLCIRDTSHGLCLSVCPSVTSRCSTKTAKRRITQTTPHDSPGTLVFWSQRFPRKFDQGHPLRGRQMQAGWVKIGDFQQITGNILKTVQDRRIVSITVE